MDLTALDDAALEQLAHDVDAERSRRRAVADAPALADAIEAQATGRLDEVAAAYRAATSGVGTVEEPVPWVAPTGAHDAWPAGSVVAHGGRVWLATRPHEVHEPGDPHSGWVEQTGDDGPSVWAVGVRYLPGARVRYPGPDGPVYVCTHEHVSDVGWEPDQPTMHTVWSKEN